MPPTLRDHERREDVPAQESPQYGPLVRGQRKAGDGMTILHTHKIGRNRKAYIECACGRRRHVWLQNVRAGKVRSCGCGRVSDLEPSRFGSARLDRAVEDAEERASRLGHALGAFDPDVPNVAAVAFCVRCDELASVDLSEAPYLFGHATDRRCEALA